MLKYLFLLMITVPAFAQGPGGPGGIFRPAPPPGQFPQQRFPQPPPPSFEYTRGFNDGVANEQRREVSLPTYAQGQEAGRQQAESEFQARENQWTTCSITVGPPQAQPQFQHVISASGQGRIQAVLALYSQFEMQPPAPGQPLPPQNPWMNQDAKNRIKAGQFNCNP